MYGFLMLFISVLFVGAPDDVAQKDQVLMQGTWRIMKFEIGGDGPKPPDEEIKKGRLIIKENKITPRMGEGKDMPSETFTLDAGKNPKAIDMTTTTVSETRDANGVVERKEDKRMTQGIYRIEGDTLTLCFTDAERPNATSKDRPTEFTVQGHNNRFMLVLERVKEGK